MHAVVLVGGFGSRLRPLTNDIPKPMLPIGHVPMIGRLIDRLARGGVTDVTLALGFRPEPFIAAFPDGEHHGVRLGYAVEPEPLDTAGAVRFAADQAGIDSTFVVANGDVMTDLDIAELADAHRKRGAEATIHLIAVDEPSAFGVVDLDVDGAVRAFVEKPSPGTEPSNLVNAGTYVFERSVLDRIRPGIPSSIERDIFPAIAADGCLYGVATDDYWLDAGRPELFLQANVDLLEGRWQHDRCDAVSKSAVVAETAEIERSIVGAGASVGERVRLERSVLLPGAVVAAGSVVRDSIVMGTVGMGSTVDGSVIGASGRIDDGEVVSGELRPDPAA